MIAVRVIGLPAAQGSKRHVGGGRLVEMSKSLPAWRKAVEKAAAAAVAKHGVLDGPLTAAATFVMPRPKKPKYDQPAVPPDLDKLLRAIGDGLEKGGLITNDSRIVAWTAAKRYQLPGEATGAYITLDSKDT